MRKVLIISLLCCVSGIFAAHVPEEGSSMVLASQAAMKLAREFEFNEDQQKMLSARLNEMADRSGFIDSQAARDVANQVKAQPTQAGSAPVKAGEAEDESKKKGERKKVMTGKKSEQEQAILDFLEKHGKAEQSRQPGGVGVYAQQGLLEKMGSQIAEFMQPLPWNIKFAPGEVARELYELKGTVGKPKASTDGRFLARQDLADTIHILNMQIMEIKQIKLPQGYFWRALSVKGDMVAASSYNPPEVVIFNVKDGTEVRHIPVLADELSFFEENGELRLVCFNPTRGMMTIWNVQTGAQLYSDNITMRFLGRVPSQELGYPGRVILSHDGKMAAILTNGDLEALRIWDVQSGKLLQTLRVTNGKVFNDFVFDFDNQRLATIVKDGKRKLIAIWDLNSGELICVLPSEVRDAVLLFSPDGRYLVEGSISSNIKVFDLAEILRRQSHNKQVAAPAAAAPAPASAPVVAPAVAPVPAAAPVPSLPSVSRRLTLAQAKKEFVVPSTIRKRTAWVNELNKLAAKSPDRKINYEDARQLYEDIKNR